MFKEVETESKLQSAELLIQNHSFHFDTHLNLYQFQISENIPNFWITKDFLMHAEMHDKLAVTAVRSNLKLKSEYFDLDMMI